MDVPALSAWRAEVGQHFPKLPGWAVRGLAEWSLGIAATQHCGTNTVSSFIAELTDEQPNTVRQRLREFYQQADRKRGPGRTDFDVSSCFVPLLRWARSLDSEGETSLALALDATTLRDVFTVLSVSVLVAGRAIPVAWVVRPARQSSSDRSLIEALFTQLKPAVPQDVSVVVTADRGLYAPWLFTLLVDLGWHPLLRINPQGQYRQPGQAEGRELAALVAEAGQHWAQPVVCFKQHPLTCTLVVRQQERHDEPWVLLTDLPPEQVESAWYGVRAWIEAGFKDLKRGALKWHLTRTTVPEHAARQWLALSVALLWLSSLGSQPQSPNTAAAVTQPGQTSRRLLSATRLGFLRLLARLIRALPCLPQHLDFNWQSRFVT